MNPENPDFDRALKCAVAYRKLGLTPLPSREDVKKPTLFTFSQYRTEAVPEAVYTPREWQTPNIQLLTGACVLGHLRVLAVDLDGEEARRTFKRMCRLNGLSDKRFWITWSPSGGRHLYFSVPKGVDRVPTRMIWGLATTYGRQGRPEWVKHQEIKILGDGALVVAPPSIHVDHRTQQDRYQFQNGYGPKDFSRPMSAPSWLLDMPICQLPTNTIPPGVEKGRGLVDDNPLDPLPSLDLIQDSISPDQKIDIARSWGLRFAFDSRATNSWATCYSIDGEDQHPSACFHAGTGQYKDHRSDKKVPRISKVTAVTIQRHKCDDKERC